MQTAFPVLSKQKMPVIPFQVSASPEKKRIFFSLGLFSPPFIDTGIEKGGNAVRKLIFNSQKKHVDLRIVQFTYFFQMKNNLNNGALKK